MKIIEGFSIEALPRTAALETDFRELLPTGTRMYIAHVPGTPIEDMVAAARRLCEQGFPVMPHVPARLVDGRDSTERRASRRRW